MKSYENLYNETMHQVKEEYGKELTQEEFYNEFELTFMALNDIHRANLEEEFFDNINWDETYLKYSL
jgi:C-terminal processing protease CtpA/Prc